MAAAVAAATTAMVAAAVVTSEVPSSSGADNASSPSPQRTTTTATKNKKQSDLLDTTVAYLKQREGIDKTLKIVRYTARLVAATSPKDSRAHVRCENLQKALGSARKAYRLGKFLQHVSAYRSLPLIDWRLALTDSAYRASHSSDLLTRAATLGEGAYYFLDQLAFYFKAGAFGEQGGRKGGGSWERRLSRLSAWAEAVGYACNIALGLARVRQLAAAEAALRRQLMTRYHSRSQQGATGGGGGGGGGVTAEEVARLKALRTARRLRSAAIAQDAADSLLALSDLLDGGGGCVGRAVSHPALLALCGLLSAAVSTQKNWAATVAATTTTRD